MHRALRSHTSSTKAFSSRRTTHLFQLVSVRHAEQKEKKEIEDFSSPKQTFLYLRSERIFPVLELRTRNDSMFKRKKNSTLVDKSGVYCPYIYNLEIQRFPHYAYVSFFALVRCIKSQWNEAPMLRCWMRTSSGKWWWGNSFLRHCINIWWTFYSIFIIYLYHHYQKGIKGIISLWKENQGFVCVLRPWITAREQEQDAKAKRFAGLERLLSHWLFFWIW